ncbi:MAG: lipoate--protein ligase family protein [Acidimicrobiia bacterium]
MNQFTFVDEGFSGAPAMDIAVSHAILSAVSRGELGGVFRLHVPQPVVAFGRADRIMAGYPEAIRAAEAHGYAAVERLAGGRAAVFHQSTLAFSWAVPDPEPRAGIRDRFELISTLMAEAFGSLGLDAHVGPIPGEYCYGDYSVNVAGLVKVMGVGQRLVRGAAHVGGVVVVDEGWRIRDVLIPIYRSLALDWDPRTAGALADRAPGLTIETATSAIIAAAATRIDLVEGSIPQSVIADAANMIDDHLPKVA